MASEFQAVSYAQVVQGSKAGVVRWNRVIPAALAVAIVAAFATPVFAAVLLAAVLVAPVVVAGIAIAASKAERA